jgi:hypothetical protein
MQLRRQQLITALLAVIIMLFMVVDYAAAANGAMPYTEEALDRLNAATVILRAPNDLQGDDDYRVRTYINRYREIFAAAGYDYEKSIIRIINDIQFERYRVNKATIKLNALARELLRMHVRTNINPRKYLGKDCAEMLIEFRTLIRSNAQKYGSC